MGRNRALTEDYVRQILDEARQEGNLMAVVRKHGQNYRNIMRWKKKLGDRGQDTPTTKASLQAQVKAPSGPGKFALPGGKDITKLEAEIKERDQLIVRLTLENARLKERS